MARQPRLSSGLGQVLPKSVVDQLVPKNKTLGDLINFYGQGLLGEGKGAKTFIPPVKNMEQMYGKPDTKGGEALNFLMDIPLAGLEAGRLFTGGISALTNPAGNIFGDYLNQPSEKRRKEIAQNIATGTSGIEIGLPIDKSIPLGGIGADPKIGQTLKELAKTEKRDAGEFASIESDAGEATKRSTMDLPGEFEAEQAAIEQAKKESTQLGDMSQEGAEMEIITPEMREPVISEEEKKTQAQQSLFKSAMDEINTIYGKDSGKDKTRKTLEEYKKDFAEATGIDVSGEPDNKLALMSLGLSLMQNRAGKGFNLSNIIGAAGEAGQKALPLFEKAKQEARAGQVAAGKYALGERKADITAELATAKEKRAALAGVAKEFRGYANKGMLERMKLKNALDIKRLEFENKGINPKGKLTEARVLNQPNLKINKGYVAGNKNIVFLNAESEAKAHANAYANVLEAENAIGEMERLVKQIGGKPTASAVTLLLDSGKRLLKPLGIGGETDYSKGYNLTKEEIKNNITPQKQIEILQKRLISQYKKFLTKETGNGVSEGDIKRLQELLGDINYLKPLEENLQAFEELRTIFGQPKRELESVFTDFANRKNHMSEDSYNSTMTVINRAISTGTDDLYSSSFKDGTFTIDLRKK